MNEVNKFELLSKVDFKPLIKTKGKGGSEYAPWGSHWSEFKKVYPKGSFEFVENEFGGYVFEEKRGDEVIGYNVKVSVCDGEEFPTTIKINRTIMNHSMKADFTFTAKEVNTASFRCLAKCCSLFGSGIAVFAGEEWYQYEIGDELDEAKEDLIMMAKEMSSYDERAKAVKIIGYEGRVAQIKNIEEANEKKVIMQKALDDAIAKAKRNKTETKAEDKKTKITEKEEK